MRASARRGRELDELCRLHAQYFEMLLERAERDWTRMSRTEWVDLYSFIIDDARAATDWAFSAEGDIGQAVRLTALLLPLGFQFALVDEMATRIDAALARAEEANPRELVAEIRLHVSHASFSHMRTPEKYEEEPHLNSAMELARLTGNPATRSAR